MSLWRMVCAKHQVPNLGHSKRDASHGPLQHLVWNTGERGHAVRALKLGEVLQHVVLEVHVVCGAAVGGLDASCTVAGPRHPAAGMDRGNVRLSTRGPAAQQGMAGWCMQPGVAVARVVLVRGLERGSAGVTSRRAGR